MQRTGVRAVYLFEKIAHRSNVGQNEIRVFAAKFVYHPQDPTPRVAAKFVYHGDHPQDPTPRHRSIVKRAALSKL